jgi:cysteinyl-tRNA synthetase
MNLNIIGEKIQQADQCLKELENQKEELLKEKTRLMEEEKTMREMEHLEKIKEDFNVDDSCDILFEKVKYITVNAINRAREIYVKQEGGYLEDFDNRRYCEDCLGWDGESGRCECGNRRLKWQNKGFHDLFGYEAY